jgi:hypothetical protein
MENLLEQVSKEMLEPKDLKFLEDKNKDWLLLEPFAKNPKFFF